MTENLKQVSTRVVNLTAEDGQDAKNPAKAIGKFILLHHNQKLVFVFGPLSQFSYHAQLLERFCNQEKIPSWWEKRPDELDYDHRQIELKGGGWLEIDNAERSLKIFGESKAYGEFDRSDLNYILATDRFFEGFSLQVD